MAIEIIAPKITITYANRVCGLIAMLCQNCHGLLPVIKGTTINIKKEKNTYKKLKIQILFFFSKVVAKKRKYVHKTIK
jgi:hypothetical protein